MTDPLVRAQGRGCVAQLAILAATALVCTIIFGLVFAAGSLAPAGTARIAVAGITLLVLVFAFAGSMIAFAARQTRVFDAAFAGLGVTASGAFVNLREFHGVWQGRELDALYSRRGPLLELHVGARLHGALAVGSRTAAGEVLRGLVGAAPVALADPAFADLVVSSPDPAWAARVLAVPAVREGVLRAVVDPSGRELRVVALRPGAVRLTRRYFEAPQAVAEVAPMVAHLAALAAAVEQLPPPAVPVALSPLERAARKAPGALAGKLVLAIVGGLLALVVVLTAAVLAVSASSPPPGSAGPAPNDEAPAGTRRRRRF